MNKLIMFTILLSTIVFAAEPKFHFQDCVKVKSGFYKGCKGHVIAFYGYTGVVTKNFYSEYDVSIDSCLGKSLQERFNEEMLIKSNGCDKE
jgi:hypothetical protein